MKKILIFGNSGSGKSTFAEKLGDKLGIKVCHLDEICCDDNYKRLPSEISIPRIQKIMNTESWIIEGNYSSTLFHERINQADTVCIIEMPAYICLFQSIKRFLAIAWKKEERIGNAKKQKNSISLKFIYWIIWRYPQNVAKRMNSIIMLHEKDISIQRFHSWMNIAEFLKKIN